MQYNGEVTWRVCIPFLAILLVACGTDAVPTRMCASDEDCRGGVCVADEARPRDLEPLELACGEESADGGDVGKRCEAAEDCARGICLLAGACAMPCASDDQCGALERCQDTFARTAPAMLQPVRTCVPIVTLPKDARVMLDVREDALTGITVHKGMMVLPLDAIRLPGAKTTTWFVLEHADDDAWPKSMFCRPPLCPLTLRARGKTSAVLFDRSEIDRRCPQIAPPEQFTGPLNTVNDDDHANPIVAMIPNGPASIVTDAGYDITVSDEMAGDLRVLTVAHDTTDDDGAERMLDLNVFWVGVDRDDTRLDTTIEELDVIFADAAIRIGDVRHVDVKGDLPNVGTTFEMPEARGKGFKDLAFIYGVHAEQPALFRLSAGAPDAAANVFVVDSIDPGKGDPFGKSGGTPGPPGMHGTGSSGVVVEVGQLTGRTLAHELGHWLGLFHTSEAMSATGDAACVFEPLQDTPECHVDRDTDGDGHLSCEECAGAGAENLMFPTACEATELSPQQIAILRTAPVLHR